MLGVRLVVLATRSLEIAVVGPVSPLQVLLVMLGVQLVVLAMRSLELAVVGPSLSRLQFAGGAAGTGGAGHEKPGNNCSRPKPVPTAFFMHKARRRYRCCW